MVDDKKITYVVLTNNETNRSESLCAQLRNAVDDKLIKIISIPFAVDQVLLARKGVIELFPSHWVSEKLYSSSTRMYKPGTLGCMLNHYISCAELLKDEHDFYVVLEDNAELAEGFHLGISDIIS